ncbi:hypothetical protein [Thalassolituus marinus]|uniref:Uncharacterized protein n=1 Tax=Thalassolituus marinus TaxID=671053 RepID=A0ABS7ZSN2_9GAMM|nr:hypothetical protein [Thalassolituus marinus]MCA6063410.1 hypothetical protein [Thalassolituus marinus]
MNVRSIVASSVFVAIFLAFLIWLYFIGRISIFGVIVILVSGGIFVSMSKFLYKNFWGEE